MSVYKNLYFTLYILMIVLLVKLIAIQWIVVLFKIWWFNSFINCSFVDLSSGFEGGLGDVAIEVLHMLLSYILQHTEDELGIIPDSVEAFVQALRRGKYRTTCSKYTICV